jgi:hypothetical protein
MTHTLPMFAADPGVPLGPEPDRDTWCTRARLRDVLVRFTDGKPVHLDPCTNERSIIPALTKYTREMAPTADPIRPWFGTVWCNWPWSKPEPWVRASYEETRDGNAQWVVGCGICDPSVGWFDYVWKAAAICFPAQREDFDPPPGAKESTNMHPIALPLWLAPMDEDDAQHILDRFFDEYSCLGRVQIL